MNSTHTPGPWLANGPTVCAAPSDAAPTGYALAHILNPYVGAVGSADRVAANARLIAAAPDLLAALMRLMPMLENTYQVNGVLHPYLAAARAAIAKATQ